MWYSFATYLSKSLYVLKNVRAQRSCIYVCSKIKLVYRSHFAASLPFLDLFVVERIKTKKDLAEEIGARKKTSQDQNRSIVKVVKQPA